MTQADPRTAYPFSWNKRRAAEGWHVFPATANRTCPACKQQDCEPSEVMPERTFYRCPHQWCGGTWSVSAQGNKPEPEEI